MTNFLRQYGKEQYHDDFRKNLQNHPPPNLDEVINDPLPMIEALFTKILARESIDNLIGIYPHGSGHHFGIQEDAPVCIVDLPWLPGQIIPRIIFGGGAKILL